MDPRTPTNHSSRALSNQPALPTFMDHIRELRGRLFWIAVIFLVASAAAYPFRDIIINFLVAPLDGMELYYLTPAGGFSFIIKVCTYVGIVATMPAVIYHLYRYLQPAVGKIQGRTVLSYVFFSTLLALTGIAFAYFVSLPAALHFLTNFDLKSVTAMLTVDAYFSFVTTYLIGAALLFQLPLLLLIINSIVTLPPRKLMSYQRHMLLGAFVVAAIISPTPDIMNQALLAGPIIAMYQVGILLVWLRNITKKSPKHTPVRAQQPIPHHTGGAEPKRQPLVPQATLDELTLALSMDLEKHKLGTAKKGAPSLTPVTSTKTVVMNQALAGHKSHTLQKTSAQKPSAPQVVGPAHKPVRSRPPVRSTPQVHRYRTVRPSTTSSLAYAHRQPSPQTPRYIDGFSVPSGSAI